MSDQLLQNIFEKLVEMDKRITKMDDRITKMDGRITKMDDRITKMDGRITNIENTMATKSELEEIKKNMATKKDVEELPWIKLAVQEINQRTIEMQGTQDDVTARQNIQRSLIAENAEDIRIIKEDIWQLRKNA